MIRKFAGLLAVFATLALAGCGYNDLQRQDEGIKAAWSEVLNQYQRRADLVPNLVNTVKGYAAQEEKVLTEVTNARASVAGIKATPELVNDPVAFQKFIKAQGELTGALSRLLVVAENYPQLKSDALFRDLTAQLEGTENRITVARNRYIKTVQEFNTTVRQFPTNLTAMIFKMDVKPNFTVENEATISAPPKVDFNKPAAGACRTGGNAGAAAPATPATPPAPQPAPKADAQQHNDGAIASRDLREVSIADHAHRHGARGIASCSPLRSGRRRRGLSAQAWEAGTDGLLPIPPLTARVTDLTQTLAPAEAAALEAKLADWEARTSNQLVVLMVPTTQPEPIEAYSLRVAEKWKIGRKGQDNGALFLIAKNDRKMRIEVGYGLEGVLPDVTANRIIREDVAPAFREGSSPPASTPASTGSSRSSAASKRLPPAKTTRARRRASAASTSSRSCSSCSSSFRSSAACCAACSAGSADRWSAPASIGVVAWLVAGSILFGIVGGIVAFLVMLAMGMGGGTAHRGGGWTSTGSGWGGGGLGRRRSPAAADFPAAAAASAAAARRAAGRSSERQ